MRVVEWFTARRVTGLLAFLIVVYATVKLVEGMRSGEPELAVTLIYWFVWWLAFFHFRYAFARNLSEFRVRLIDYGYLSVAAFSVIFYAQAQSDQREAARVSLRESLEVQISTVRKQLQTQVAEIIQRDCPKGASRGPICWEVTQFAGILERESRAGMLSIEQLESIGRSLEVAERKAPRQDISALKENLGTYFLVSGLQAQLAAPPRGGETTEMATVRRAAERGAYIFGQYFVWPFLLTLALALRITKVSIEILGWASKPSKVASG